jgi:hypothetical protein
MKILPMLLRTLALALSASGVCALAVYVFLDAFSRGATASGLNPGGGGPGFLLLLPPAIAGLVSGLWGRQYDGVLFAVAFGVFGGGLVAASVFSMLSLVTPSDFPPISPLATSAGVSFVVARVVVGALQGLPDAEPAIR